MNPQLRGLLVDIEKRMSELVIENKQLKNQLAASPNLDNLTTRAKQNQGVVV